MSNSAIGFVYMPGGGLTLTLHGHPHIIHPEHQNIDEIWKVLGSADLDDQAKEQRLQELIQTPAAKLKAAIQEIEYDDIQIEHGVVVVNGEEIHNTLTEKILEIHKAGRDFSPLVHFMVNLFKNPSKASRDQLFDFLDQAGFPITPDGCFLSYKGVKDSFWDQHTGRTFQYLPGTVIEMAREDVCADPNQGCAAGIHVGTLGYAKGFSSKVILLKVNPADAVSVPRDHNFAKIRVCRCEVIRVYEGQQVLARPVYDDEEIQDDELLTADEDYRRLTADGMVLKQKTFDELFEEYNQVSRDDICRQAASAGYFLSTNEARDMGKDFVVLTMASKGLPYEKGRRDQLAKLAARRGLFSSVSSALHKGREVIVAALQEDIEQRMLLLASTPDDSADASA